MNSPCNVPEGRRPKSYICGQSWVFGRRFLDSSPNISESMDLIKIEIECKILSPQPPHQQYMRFSYSGFWGCWNICLPYLSWGPLIFDGRKGPAMGCVDDGYSELHFSCSSRTSRLVWRRAPEVAFISHSRGCWSWSFGGFSSVFCWDPSYDLNLTGGTPFPL